MLGAYFNPNGHPPPNMEISHFDLYCYYYNYLSTKERAAISGSGICVSSLSQQNFCNSIMQLSETYFPTDYTPMSVVLSQMGFQLMNFSEPDMYGVVFLQDMVYGICNSSIAFKQANINLQTMHNVINGSLSDPYYISFANAMPKYVSKAGWYASQICTRFNTSSGIGYSELNNFI